MQFISFVGAALSADELQRRLPKLEDLLTQNFLATDVAFALCRFTINQQINAKWEEFKKLDRKDKEKQTTSAKVRASSANTSAAAFQLCSVLLTDGALRGSDRSCPGAPRRLHAEDCVQRPALGRRDAAVLRHILVAEHG